MASVVHNACFPDKMVKTSTVSRFWGVTLVKSSMGLLNMTFTDLQLIIFFFLFWGWVLRVVGEIGMQFHQKIGGGMEFNTFSSWKIMQTIP